MLAELLPQSRSNQPGIFPLALKPHLRHYSCVDLSIIAGILNQVCGAHPMFLSELAVCTSTIP